MPECGLYGACSARIRSLLWACTEQTPYTGSMGRVCSALRDKQSFKPNRSLKRLARFLFHISCALSSSCPSIGLFPRVPST